MAKELMGNACAYIKNPGMTKAKYLPIGKWFQDNDTGRISIVFDALPLPHQSWSGWVNLFENDNGFSQNSPKPRASTQASPVDLEDDIPF